MKIISVKFKNFNSYGNALTEVKFNGHDFHLLRGVSGSGKSTIREVICYGLFGKVEGKTNPTLVNRFNKKGLYVEIEATATSGAKIQIKRGGEKQSTFKVYIDDEEQKENPKVIQQKLIDEHYKMDLKTFNNLIAISIDNFKSFLSMSAKEKRDIIDNLFGLTIFNKYSESLKSEFKKYSTDISSLQYKIDTLVSSKKTIEESISAYNENYSNEVLQKIDKINEGLLKVSPKLEQYLNKLSELSSKRTSLDTKYNHISKEKSSLEAKIRDFNNKIDLFEEDKCPTCSASFDSDYYSEIKVEYKKNVESLKTTLTSKNEVIKKIEVAYNKIDVTQNKLKSNIDELKGISIQLKTKKTSLESSLNENEKRSNIDNTLIDNYIKDIEELEVKVNDVQKTISVINTLLVIFGKDGIKKDVLSTIVPSLNKRINEYRKQVSFPYEIHIDENFNSSIKNMGGEVSIKTLSTGETKKADFSVLLSIIEIMKNTYPTMNLLFLDELIYNIDENGVNEILSLIKKFVKDMKMNIFIVNHSELPIDYFDVDVEVEKLDSFSKMTVRRVKEKV